jgi:hypothetical protein
MTAPDGPPMADGDPVRQHDTEPPRCARVGLHNCGGEWRNHDRANDLPEPGATAPETAPASTLPAEQPRRRNGGRLMPYPTDFAGRQKIRADHRRRVLAEAELYGRTITCRQTADHTTCRGAKVCLCECHDPKEPQP